jgi:hypothetical protein
MSSSGLTKAPAAVDAWEASCFLAPISDKWNVTFQMVPNAGS